MVAIQKHYFCMLRLWSVFQTALNNTNNLELFKVTDCLNIFGGFFTLKHVHILLLYKYPELCLNPPWLNVSSLKVHFHFVFPLWFPHGHCPLHCYRSLLKVCDNLVTFCEFTIGCSLSCRGSEFHSLLCCYCPHQIDGILEKTLGREKKHIQHVCNLLSAPQSIQPKWV